MEEIPVLKLEFALSLTLPTSLCSGLLAHVAGADKIPLTEMSGFPFVFRSPIGLSIGSQKPEIINRWIARPPWTPR